MIEVVVNNPARFSIEIDFKKGAGDPSRVFRAMSDLISALHDVDRALIGTIDTRLEPLLLLEDVETGSIKSWLRQALESVDDNALKTGDWKAVVGHYLVKGKHIIINFLSEETQITNAQQITDLETKLLNAAEETGIKQIPVYVPPSRKQLLQGMESISEALSPLMPEDKASFSSTEGTVDFNLTFSIAPEQIEDLITSEIIETPTPMIMKVKKPDFLGESMWDFRYDNRTIEVKIMDAQWLAAYQSGKVPVNPGDAIKANVLVVVRYGLDREVLSTQYSLIKVLEVIPKDRTEQGQLFS
jgi:hypothetical protein